MHADVADYLAAIPAGMRADLLALRKTILAAVPGATEVISYGIPTVRFEDRGLVGYGAAAGHGTFYLMSTEIMKTLAADLEGLPQGRGSVRFAAGDPLPATLVKKLVRARIAENRSAALATATRALARKKKPRRSGRPR